MKTKELTITALCCALTAILAPMTITLPFTLIPFSLSLIPIFLTGAILPKRHAFLAIVLYVLLGLIGLPVFSGFASGVGVLAGPTGGFVVGYPFTALAVAWAVEKRFSLPRYAVGAIIGMVVCYLPGSVWYAISAGVPYGQALLATVVPFVLWDALKAVLAGAVAAALRRALPRVLQPAVLPFAPFFRHNAFGVVPCFFAGNPLS